MNCNQIAWISIQWTHEMLGHCMNSFPHSQPPKEKPMTSFIKPTTNVNQLGNIHFRLQYLKIEEYAVYFPHAWMRYWSKLCYCQWKMKQQEKQINFCKKKTREDKMRLQPKIKNHIIINKRVYLKWCTHSSGCEWKAIVG